MKMPKNADELADSVSFLNAVINHAGDPIFVKDAQSRIILANDSFCSIFGLQQADILGKTLAENVPEKEREQFLRIDKQVLTDGIKNVTEETLTLNGKASRTIITTKTRYTNVNGDHFIIGVISDITELKLLEQQLREKANTDFLTNLHTRRHFMDLANQELNRLARYDSPLSFMVLDIDLFKLINDTYGHQSGDIVIMKFAEICQSILRSVDIMGRIGGEEFAVMLPETNKDKAMEVAERLRERIENMRVVLEENQTPITFTVSIGLVSVTSKDKTLQELLNLADQALYQAKNTGRNRVCVVKK